MIDPTPGKLLLDCGCIYAERQLDENGMTYEKPLAEIIGDTENHDANARRLVACWNACEGFYTESLEHNKPLADQFVDVLNQRYELLEALKGFLEYFESGNQFPVHQATIKANSDVVIAARTAIQKATQK